MARTRTLSPLFWEDADLAARSQGARLLFLGLLNLADREGRLPDVPPWIKAKVFPYEDLDVEPLLVELTSERAFSSGTFLTRYSAGNGNKYIQINNFKKYQHPHPKEAQSEIPPPPCNSAERRGKPWEAAESRGEDVASPSIPSVPSVSSNPSSVSAQPTTTPPKTLWWDPEEKRLSGTPDARDRLRTKWLERGLSEDEFQDQIDSLNRWLEDRPQARGPRANFANRINNWMNKHLTWKQGRDSS